MSLGDSEDDDDGSEVPDGVSDSDPDLGISVPEEVFDKLDRVTRTVVVSVVVTESLPDATEESEGDNETDFALCDMSSESDTLDDADREYDSLLEFCQLDVDDGDGSDFVACDIARLNVIITVFDMEPVPEVPTY